MKVITTDLDGTFLEPDSKVPLNADTFINRMRENGFLVIFATARPFGDVKINVLNQVTPDWLICNDGAVAVDFTDAGVSIKIENNLDNKIAIKNALFMESKGIMPLFFMGSKHDFKVYLPKSFSEKLEEHIRLSDQTRPIEKYEKLEQILKLGSIRSVSVYGNIDQKIADFFYSINPDANVLFYRETRFPGEKWLDVISIEADKFLVSKKIASFFGIDKINIGLGNGPNDNTLLSNSIWSSCPISASELIKKIVTYVSPYEEGEMFLNDIAQIVENI